MNRAILLCCTIALCQIACADSNSLQSDRDSTQTSGDTIFLLSDNQGWPNNIVPADVPRISSGATLEFVTSGSYASNREFLNTGSRPDGKKRALLDGNCGTGEFGSDKTMAWGAYDANDYWGTFIIDLKSQYLITKVSLWPVMDKKRNFEHYDILLSNDGRNFTLAGQCKSPELTPEQAETTKVVSGTEVSYELPRPALARYVMFRVAKKRGFWQLIVAEAAVFGKFPPPGTNTALLPENIHDPINVKAIGVQSGAVTLDWSESARKTDGVKKWRIYRGEKPFSKITDPGVSQLDIVPYWWATRKTIYPLTPDRDYYFAVTAEYASGEYPVVNPISYHSPKPFYRECFDDMLGINFFWDCERENRSNQDAWNQAALDLLATTPFRHIKWWETRKDVLEKLYAHSMNQFTVEANDLPALGIYERWTSNEPDIHGALPAVQLETITKPRYLESKKQSPDIMVAAPACCTDNMGLAWLEKFYEAGAKPYFDVLDVHTYLNSGGEVYPPGYPPGSPEALFERMEKIRAIMKKFGDEDKPIISSEFGYTDCIGPNPAGNISPERKAQYLVRGLIIHYVLGFRRVFVYSFFDTGTNLKFSEHRFGMIDYYLQKKPAFFAVCTLGRELKNSILNGETAGVKPPHYGYDFQERATGKITHVIWNGANPYIGTFSTTPGEVEITDMMGNKRTVRTREDGSFRALFGPSPIYIRTQGTLELKEAVINQEETGNRADADGNVELTIPEKTITVMPENSATVIPFELRNTNDQTREVKIELADANGNILNTKTIQIGKGMKKSDHFSEKRSDKALTRYHIYYSYEGKYNSFSQKESCYIRTLQPNKGNVAVGQTMMSDYSSPVWFISNDQWEIIIDSRRGGRVLDMIDKTTGANQVNLNYDDLATLESIRDFYWWDSVRCDKKQYNITANQSYLASAEKNGIAMTAQNDGLRLTKRFFLTSDALLNEEVQITNTSKEELTVSYYLHPEYTVGGVAESMNDIIRMQVGSEIVEIPFWTGLGARSIIQTTGNWWEVRDVKNQITMHQTYSPEFNIPRIWFGRGFYNLEMTTRKVKLAPGESMNCKLTWKLLHKTNSEP